MVDPQTSRFWQAAVQSQLIDVPELRACWDALPPEKQVADQLDRRLARQAVHSGRLTLWQAQQLLAGRSTGFKIDRYVLLNMIGQGGMGRVYLARDSRLNRQVALKILSPERVNNPRAIARFQREARVGAQLQHENLVRIYDEGESNGKCYLVMEYIQGKTIGSMISSDGPLPPSLAARLTRQIAMGLEHAHQKGLIHRDVNPYNIMVTGDGTAKLADLGLAIDLAEQIPVTRDGATVGTFDYISPEQARHSHSVDTRSDIYSLGCTLYHMLAGHVPFQSPSLPEKLFGHQAIEPQPLTELIPSIPPGLTEVVRKMMQKRPEDRYANPVEVAQALEPFVNESATPYRSTELPLAPDAAMDSSGSMPMPTHSSTKVTTGRRETITTPPSPENSPTAQPQTLESHASETTEFTPSLTENLLEGLVTFEPPAPIPAAPVPDDVPAPIPAPPPIAEAPEPVMDFSRIGQEQPQSGAGNKNDMAGLGLALDLGPEPPLSGNLAKGKTRPPNPVTPRSKPTQPLEAAKAPAVAEPKAHKQPPEPLPRPESLKNQRRGRYLMLAAVATAALLVAVTGGLFATGVLGKAAPNRDQRPRKGLAVSDLKPLPKAVEAEATAAEVETRPAQRSGITVKAADGTTLVEPTLKAAMQKAIGSRGHVLLNNREPLRLTDADAVIKLNGGPLYIRAAEGIQPVIEVELKGNKPFLTTGSSTPLTIVGVTIVAHDPHPGATEAPPIIEAGAKVTLERCVFKSNGGRALKTQGVGLTATGTWFLGFDQALDIEAFNGSTVSLSQCIIVKSDVEASSAPGGWALRVRSQPGGGAKSDRTLNLDRCTVVGKGLLQLVNISPQMPYKIEVKSCVLVADTLLAWQPQSGDLPPSHETLQWFGQDNLYDVRGKAWIVRSPQGFPELPDGPTDLASWTKLAEESTPLSPPARFKTDPGQIPESPSPSDFLVVATERPVGADPDRVGPRLKSSKP